MARSFKRKPICKDGQKGLKKKKRFSSKTVRRYSDKIPNGNFYKKIFPSYNIHDYISFWSWQEAKEEYEKDEGGRWHKMFSSIDDFYKFWRRYYRNK